MSHCSVFDVKFKDKHTLFKAMRNLNMHPENQVWATYKTTLGKKAGIGGAILGKLLTGVTGQINIFFTEENGVLIPNLESHSLAKSEIDNQGQYIVQILQKEYLKCSMEKLQKSINMSGQTASLYIEETYGSTTFTLLIEMGKKMIVTLNRNGFINESVTGVVGKSCVDLSKMLESLMTDSISRQWTEEYNEFLEDQAVQVLKLR